MVLCGCKNARCHCRLGSGIDSNVTGNGTERNPYKIDVTDRTLAGEPNSNAAVTVTGTGQPGDPWVVQMDIDGGSASQTIFTSSGSWQKPPTGTIAHVVVIGGGGGGGASAVNGGRGGGGGTGGAMSTGWFALEDLPDEVNLQVGTGGAGATPGGSTRGANGIVSYFGDFLRASGGSGGDETLSSPNPAVVAPGGTAPEGGPGGYGAGYDGNVFRPAEDHLDSQAPTGGGIGYGATGGVGPTPGGSLEIGRGWGGRGGSGTGSVQKAPSGGLFGGGGGGGYAGANPRQAGGNGAPGVVVVTVW